ncbi:DNA polymerase I [Chitinophaga ginsengisegetis]|uniref:DNA polymerase I n=1 Tax=Chitinophaga ginsengisegetis TaxID=393003 RepID=A0A1T5P7M6_9BACT|nr:DNA polymerase I [Chitinophaga ginsengisegetis]MDR6566171.1 DNA polymerase-1 [Chitinophaga ginsengisegetis]MDR6645901.1 DNA polymerase-1 [Chitinophaga ginsengisegetis]MDR6651507.1 DNA polymerase-1 [Chitinophaga ginsengisegetis]SKD08289.1 DNA polymerase I [Chitinophaga ginsengisegetis]
MEKKLFLLDAMALIYRAYYALIRNPRITSAGRNTNAQFGFTTTLLDLINKEKPTHIAVAFDTHAPTERHTTYTDYKANREDAPEDLLDALPDIKRIIEGFNIPVVELDGYEADDVIGTLAWQAADAGYTVYMVTPDKDYGQLVRDNIFIYKPPYMGNKEEIMGPKEVCEKWQIKDVHQVIDILGLMGDAVDNIPGIAGIGEKTAMKLLAQYHTLENVLDNADTIGGKMGEKIKAGRENALLSKELATIITDVPVTFHEEDFCIKDCDKGKLTDIFMELEFKTLGKRILGDGFAGSASVEAKARVVQTDLFGTVVTEEVTVTTETVETGNILLADKNIHNTPHEYEVIDTLEKRTALLQQLLQQSEVSFDTETTGTDANDAEIVGMSFSFKKGVAYYIPMPADNTAARAIIHEFTPLFQHPSIILIGQNIKYDMLILKWYGMEITTALFDTMLAHYLIEPEGRRSMDVLSAQYLQYEPVSIESLIGKKGKGQGSMRDVEIEKIKEYAAEDADITLQLKEKFAPMLPEKAVDKVFYDIENPLVKVLADMEYEGIALDTMALADYSKELEIEIKRAEESVYEQAGVRFKLASPKQLGEVLFEKLQLDPKAKKTRTGQYATGEDVLQKLSNKHKIVEDILIFRELSKLKSTYVDSLPLLLNKRTNRIHTSYNQAVAVTGRLSSNNPNLQNIPIRTDRGREIRKAFIPRNEEFVLLSADYSQIELRIIAAISEDKEMMAAFQQGIDIHAATAAKVYNVPLEEVTSDMRRNSKSVNFGIIYGVSAFGLSENLGIPRSEAKMLIDNYFAQYPSIKKYMDDQIKFASEKGYVQTLLGRKRWLKDINSSNAVVRGFAERNAINMPIQGTAADMIKLAMIAIHKAFKERNLKSRMLLQVHDELVFDAHRSELEIIKPLILDLMRNALPLSVPVEAEMGTGNNWLEAH